MMRKILLLICFLSAFLVKAQDDEKLLVNETFQSWDAKSSSTTESTVTKTTDFSNETLLYKLMEIQVAPAGENAKFTGADITPGYLMCSKTGTTYIELSPLESVTRIEAVQAGTGGNRGFQIWKKIGNGDWESIHETYISPASGQKISIDINGENVALKFTNLLTPSSKYENAYLTSLKIWGNYTSSQPQVNLTTSVNIEGAGTIVRSINSDTYDAGTALTLTATPNFGYKFVKWMDGAGTQLSTNAEYSVILNADTEVIAVFEELATYALTVNVQGSQWGEIKLSPEPTNGKYESGTIVTLTVIENPVTTFLQWENESTTSTRTFEMTEDKTLTATFDEAAFIVGWNFKVQEPRGGRAGDFYSQSDNMGAMNMYLPNGTQVNWLANTGSFNPSYPCIRKWTGEASFTTEQRYYEATFSTVGYTNIRVESLMGGNYQVYNTQIMQYSIDGTTFKELTTVDISPIHNSGWLPCNATLPEEAENVAKVYIRWIADETSGITGTGNDGTALTNIYVYADKEIVNDEIPPVLLGTVPVEGADNASITGSITLTFDERVMVGTGDIVFNGETLVPSFGSKTATFKYSKLEYNKEYTFTLPAGAITDMSGNAFEGVTLTFTTMNREQPISQLFDYVVAQDGSGNGTTIQEAFNAVPTDGSKFKIFVKNGKYLERPTLPSSKGNISLIGQSIDDVIISAAVYSGLDGATTSTCQTVEILSNNNYFENLTIENTAGVDAGQAVALKDYGKYNTYKNVRLLGNQDTHLTGNSSVQYYKDCDIRGTVDFIFGGGDIFFDNCLLYCNARSGGGDVIVAPSTAASLNWGYVFRDCTIDGDAATQNNKYSLGRPWQNAPRAVFINTTMNILPAAAGWANMGVIPALFAEYNSMNKSGGSVDTGNRKSEYTQSEDNGGKTIGGLQTVLTDLEAATYTKENVLNNTESWDPFILTEVTESPVVNIEEDMLTWTAVNYAISYIVMNNGEVIGFTKETSYPLPTGEAKVRSNDDASFQVIAVSESGALSVPSNPVTNSITSVEVEKETDGITYAQNRGVLTINNIPDNSTIEVYSFIGTRSQNLRNISGSVNINIQENSILRINTKNGVKTIKVLKN